MFAITRGPSMKPAWAATKSSRASERSVTKTNHFPTGRPKTRTWPATFPANREFMVWSGSR